MVCMSALLAFARTQTVVLPEPVYRLAEKEFKDFIEDFTDILVESDPQIPHLPPKDVMHRIYRDVSINRPSEASSSDILQSPGPV